MSSDWDYFIESLEGNNQEWCNSLDLTALSKLRGDERERAIQLQSS